MTKFVGTAVCHTSSRPMLAPFCWAAEPISRLVDQEPSLIFDLLTASRLRTHLIALALAHIEIETELTTEFAQVLLRGSISDVLSSALNQGPPAGLGRALVHMPPQVLAKESYRRLIELLDHADSGYLLFYADVIDDSIIELLYKVPARLRRPALLLAMRRYTTGFFSSLGGLSDGLVVLAAHGAASSVDALVAELASARGPVQFANKLEAVIERLPAVEATPPPRIGLAVRQDSLAEVRAIAERFEHYISDYLKCFKQGDCAVYLWEDSPQAVCIVGRHGHFGWFLDNVKGAADTEFEPKFINPIRQVFASAGIPAGSTIESIERLYMWGG